MRGSDPDWQYKYRPKNVIFDELCMILQKRAFRITSSTNTTSNETAKRNPASSTPCYSGSYEVEEIPLKSVNSEDPHHVVVHELAFGPDSDPQVTRPVSLWFSIDEQSVVECSSSQAKRFRWKRGINKKDSPIATRSVLTLSSSSPNGDSNHRQHGLSPQSAFHFLDSFTLIRPHDRDAYELATAMMEHRIAVMTRELIPNVKERYDALIETTAVKEMLQQRFENLRKHWIDWAWPINLSRGTVTKKTPVPFVDSKYQAPLPVHAPTLEYNEVGGDRLDCSYDTENTDPALDEKIPLGKQVGRLWDSFVHMEDEVPTRKVRQNLNIVDR